MNVRDRARELVAEAAYDALHVGDRLTDRQLDAILDALAPVWKVVEAARKVHHMPEEHDELFDALDVLGAALTKLDKLTEEASRD